MASSWGNSWARAWGNSWGSIASPSIGTGGWGAALNAKPLSGKKRKDPQDEEAERRRRSVEKLEALITAALDGIEPVSEAPAEIVVSPPVIPAMPVIDWDKIERSRAEFDRLTNELNEVLEAIRAYEIKIEEDREEEDMEFLLSYV